MDDQTRDWLFNHHLEAYKFQAKRAEKILDRLSFLVTPFTVLGGGILYVLGKYQHALSPFAFFTFYVPVSLSLLLFLTALGFALYCLGRGFDYSSVPRPSWLQEDVEKISKYAANHAPELDVFDDVKTTMMRRYCDAADENFVVNFRRTTLVLRSIQIGIASFLFLLLALPSFFSNRLQEKKATSTVIFYEEGIRPHERRTDRIRRPARRGTKCPGSRARESCPRSSGEA